jgi:hypothetical protein
VNAALAKPAAAAAAPAAPARASASAPAGAAPSAPAEPRKLPKTATAWPAVGLGSMLLIASGLALSIRRRTIG